MQNLFLDMNDVLLQRKKPSLFLQQLQKQNLLNEIPFVMLSCLKKVEQSKTHHAEGNVWNHTMLVIDQAAKLREQSNDPESFMWAALLHDIGKAVTTRRRNGRITAYDHDKVGAEMAREFLQYFTDRLVFIERVAALVRWHMQLLYVNQSLPFADVKTMMLETDAHDLAMLGLCDRLGRKEANEYAEKKYALAFLETVINTYYAC